MFAWPLCVAGKIRSVSLGKVCDHLGISNAGEHTAMADVERAIAVYERLVGWRDFLLIASEARVKGDFASLGSGRIALA
jgi:DNA polymerase III epsilon subunit-like protein